MRHSLILFAFFVLLVACGGSPHRAPVTVYGTSEGPGSAGVHSVVEGDTLYSIAKRYNIVMRDIAIDNNLSAPFRLHEGMRLKLPPPQEYRVRAGDSLYTVSRLFGVSTSEIARLNDVPAPYIIRPGQTLRLPSVTRKVETSTIRTALASQTQKSAVAVPGQKPTQSKATPKKTKISAKTPKRASSKFLKPVEGRVISTYGPKKDGLHNDGINIAAAKGTPVKAAENGVVVYAGNELKGSGNLVLVRHEGRWMTAYAHMDRMLIKRGDTIKRGQSIGTVGATGSVDTPQLHFEVRRGTEAINPSIYLEG